MEFILKYFGMVAAVLLTIYLVPGVTISGGWVNVFLAALVWSVIVTVIRPILQVFTFPISILTFGLFSFVLNALLFWGMTLIVPGFAVASFWAALLGVVVLSIISWFINQVL